MRESFYLLNGPAAGCTIAGGSALRAAWGGQGADHFSEGSGDCSTAWRRGAGALWPGGGASVAGGQQRLALTIRPAIGGMSGIAAGVDAQSSRWMFGRIFGLDGRESYRELRLEPLCCPHRLSRETAPHGREYHRRND